MSTGKRRAIIIDDDEDEEIPAPVVLSQPKTPLSKQNQDKTPRNSRTASLNTKKNSQYDALKRSIEKQGGLDNILDESESENESEDSFDDENFIEEDEDDDPIISADDEEGYNSLEETVKPSPIKPIIDRFSPAAPTTKFFRDGPVRE
jgi:hypothetical protein